MAMPMRVTGGWIHLLTDWLDLYQFPAPDLRLLLDSRRQDEAVPLALWQQLLERASMLPATAVVPALEIGAQVRPRHVGAGERSRQPGGWLFRRRERAAHPAQRHHPAEQGRE